MLNLRNRPPKILLYPDEHLKRISKPINFKTTSMGDRAKVVRKMGAALVAQNWGQKLGIAAPQIGINLRVIVVRGNVMYNPEWEPSKAPQDVITEGCYSVPGKTFRVSRAPYGWARWTNIHGKPFEDKLSGLPAIVFQHEISHLNGQCLPDYAEEVAVKS